MFNNDFEANVDLITTHFNPCKFRRLRDTFRDWLPTLGPLARYLKIYELVFDNDEPEIEGSIVIRGTRDANLMWQKERMLNIGIEQSSAEYIGWLDHDLCFQNLNWLGDSIELLRSHQAVQLFDSVHYLNQKLQRIERIVQGCMVDNRKYGAPGGAWIAERAFLNRIGGLIDNNIVGAGDQAFPAIVNGHTKYLEWYAERLLEDNIRRIQEQQSLAPGASFTHCPGAAIHLWHGTLKNRNHKHRSEILSRHEFNPETDIRIGQSGLWEWATDKPDMHREVRQYFELRKEDG